jgi:hypothetical protein
MVTEIVRFYMGFVLFRGHTLVASVHKLNSMLSSVVFWASVWRLDTGKETAWRDINMVALVLEACREIIKDGKNI